MSGWEGWEGWGGGLIIGFFFLEWGRAVISGSLRTC